MFPKEQHTVNENAIVAPADGKVVVIEEVQADEYFTDRRIQVSIFMSPLNVHVNRNPVSGEVAYSQYHKGKYLVAWHPKSSTENERHSVVYRRNGKEILVKQIAGALAKRIVNYLQPGQKVKQSEEMGFIKFGSRVDVLLPLDAKMNVKIGDKPQGGVTVIADMVRPLQFLDRGLPCIPTHVARYAQRFNSSQRCLLKYSLPILLMKLQYR